MRTWTIYEVRDGGRVLWEGLVRIEAEFFAKDILNRTGRLPEIWEVPEVFDPREGDPDAEPKKEA